MKNKELKKKISFNLAIELSEKLDSISKQHHISRTTLISKIIIYFLKELGSTINIDNILNSQEVLVKETQDKRNDDIVSNSNIKDIRKYKLKKAGNKLMNNLNPSKDKELENEYLKQLRMKKRKEHDYE